MEILKYPNPILREECEEVILPLSKEDKQTLNEMYALCKSIPTALALAAPQVGVKKRMIVACIKKDGKVLFNCKIVNPIIIPKGPKNYCLEEGEECLSEPGIKVVVPRYKYITLLGYDAISNKKIMWNLDKLLAVVIQHECDHLNGVLLHDYQKENKDDVRK